MSTSAEGPFLVIGGRGMLGRAWASLLEKEGLPARCAGHEELDITDASSVRAGVEQGVRVVVNCAAWANVDGAESHEEEATAVNGRAMGVLGERCREVGALLVHYSTDYVFDGNATSPYRIGEPHAPVNAYGRGKALGERLLRGSGAEHLLLRTSWVYAPWGKNFVRTMARLCRERDLLKVVDDQRGRPTSATQLAERSLALVRAGARGTFHVTDGGECSWYELASHVVALLGSPCRVEPCSSDEYRTPAKRPAYSVLALGEATALIGEPVPWREAVAAVVRQLRDD